MLNKVLLASLGMGALLLSACGEESTLPANPGALVPTDAKLAEIYDRSCKTCHTDTDSTAPITGDTNAWADRMDKGMEELVNNVVNGYEGMPPFGLCMDCSADEFESLIKFMAEAK